MRKRWLILLLWSLCGALGMAGEVMTSSLSGSWYPGERKALQNQIQEFMKDVTGPKLDLVIALLLPHAGYTYSGPVAAYGIAQLKGKSYRRVIVIGPSHHAGLFNQIVVPEADAWQTPLGNVPLDIVAIKKLEMQPFTVASDALHQAEHSMQIDVPLLQSVLHNFKMVPVMVGQLDDSSVIAVAGALQGIIDEHTLVVISSDFTHYGPRFNYTPFGGDGDLKEKISVLDSTAVKLIMTKNNEGFSRYLTNTGATICGSNPIRLMLAMLPANAEIHELKYDTSGEITGDYSNSVSYVALAVTGSWAKEPVKPVNPDGLVPTDRTRLLALARQTIEHELRQAPEPSVSDLSPILKEKRGVFVTLHENGELRGCIGEIMPRRPLYEAVIAQARNAAFNDPRFAAVTADEIDKIVIEISVLTPPVEVRKWNDIVIGRDGIILTNELSSAVFLPQVAPEQGWNLEQTLSHLAVKAGLRANAWRENTTFQVFQADVFGEKGKRP